MATFRQAYWYTHECPLRKVNLSVFPEPESAQVIRKHIHKHVLDVFEKDQSDIVREVTKKLDIMQIRRGVGANKIAKRVHLALVNLGIWKVKHREDDIILKDFSVDIENMEINIDIARLKNEKSHIQLIWFRYDSLMPSLSNFSKLVERAQWNARGYELISINKPMQLTYFFPMLGTEYSVLYNTESNYEIIAKLISEEVYYIKPSEVCDICNECPMSWVGYKGELV